MPGFDGKPHGAPAGTQDAIATAQPLSRGATTSVDTDIFLLALEGARTEVTSRLDGHVRSATAVSTIDEKTNRDALYEQLVQVAHKKTHQADHEFDSRGKRIEQPEEEDYGGHVLIIEQTPHGEAPTA